MKMTDDFYKSVDEAEDFDAIEGLLKRPGFDECKIQENAPVAESIDIPAVIEVASRVKVRFSAGRSASVAEAVKVNSVNSSTV